MLDTVLSRYYTNCKLVTYTSIRIVGRTMMPVTEVFKPHGVRAINIDGQLLWLRQCSCHYLQHVASYLGIWV